MAAETLGTQLAKRKLALVYGGGTVGLMGTVSVNRSIFQYCSSRLHADRTRYAIKWRQRQGLDTEIFDFKRVLRGYGGRH